MSFRKKRERNTLGASSETQGQVVGSFERHRDESFQALIASFLRTQLTAPESPGWKKRKTSDFSFNTVFFLSDERPNLDIYFDQKWWTICWFEVSGNLSFQSIFCHSLLPRSMRGVCKTEATRQLWKRPRERERKKCFHLRIKNVMLVLFAFYFFSLLDYFMLLAIVRFLVCFFFSRCCPTQKPCLQFWCSVLFMEPPGMVCSTLYFLHIRLINRSFHRFSNFWHIQVRENLLTTLERAP